MENGNGVLEVAEGLLLTAEVDDALLRGHEPNCKKVLRSRPGLNKSKCTCGKGREYKVRKRTKNSEFIFPLKDSSLLPERPMILNSKKPHEPAFPSGTMSNDVIIAAALKESPAFKSRTGTDPNKVVEVQDKGVRATAESLMATLLAPDEFSKQYAAILSLNTTAAIGVYRAGNKTTAHRHGQGVLNLSLQGRKRFMFWAPTEDLNTRDIAMELVQTAGQCIWIPPLWGHEVETLHGPQEAYYGSTYAVSLAGWCQPTKMRVPALCHLTCLGLQKCEIQAKRGAKLTDKMKIELHKLVFDSSRYPNDSD